MKSNGPIILLVTASLLACSSFSAGPADVGAGNDAGEGSDLDASVPGPVQPDAAGPEAGSVATCPPMSFCDGFERGTIAGEWKYPPPSTPGTSSLEIDATTAASGTRSLAVTINDEGKGVNANELTRPFAAAPALPFEVHFALRVSELPAGTVRLLRVDFDTGSRVWVGLGSQGMAVGTDAVLQSDGVSSGSNPSELAALDAWARYTLTVTNTSVLLALDNGTHSAAVVPFVAQFGTARSAGLGVFHAEDVSVTMSARFWIDDIAMPP